MAEGKIIFIGIDISTTAVTGVGYTDKCEIVFASVPMRGATNYFGQPAFKVNELGMTVNKGERDNGMILEVVNKMEEQTDGLSWKGAICFSVRQHDQIIADRNGEPLIPVLSWQCNWADDEVNKLKTMGIEKAVGKIEPRFILPKVLKTLKEVPGIKNDLHYIMTTGDWIAWLLTGNACLSTSDALSNSLLYQKNKRLAVKVFRDVGLDPSWFPPPIQSGSLVGLIDPNASPKFSGLMPTFEPLAQKLCA